MSQAPRPRTLQARQSPRRVHLAPAPGPRPQSPARSPRLRRRLRHQSKRQLRHQCSRAHRRSRPHRGPLQRRLLYPQPPQRPRQYQILPTPLRQRAHRPRPQSPRLQSLLARSQDPSRVDRVRGTTRSQPARVWAFLAHPVRATTRLLPLRAWAGRARTQATFRARPRVRLPVQLVPVLVAPAVRVVPVHVRVAPVVQEQVPVAQRPVLARALARHARPPVGSQVVAAVAVARAPLARSAVVDPRTRHGSRSGRNGQNSNCGKPRRLAA